MSYIVFKNEVSDFVPRTYIEKLGISTKRDDPKTIGQFGSGSSLAAIAALRKGWEWISTCEDQDGPYRMAYVAEKGSDGFEHVFYDYDGEKKPSSFTLDAGVLSWDDSFQIFREAFANAIDEYIAKGAKYSVEIVDEVEIVPGHFCVYVTADPELLGFIHNFDKWFCLKRTPVIVGEDFRVFDNLGENGYDIYQKGIRIGGQNEPSVFSYELDNLKLNEERRIRDTWAVTPKITSIIRSATDSKFIETILKASAKPSFSAFVENSRGHVSEYDVVSDDWQFAWNRLYTGCIPVSKEEAKLHKSQLQTRNMGVKIIHSGFIRSILKNAGVRTLQDVLGQGAEFNYIDTPDEMQDFLDRALTLMRGSGVYDHYDITKIQELANGMKIFEPSEMQEGNLLGVYSREYENISISNECDNFLSFFATWIHEVDHAITGLGDDTQFRVIADDRIASLMIALSNRTVSITS